jgi:hypothetical protein
MAKNRASMLTVAQMFRLNAACKVITETFDGRPPYLVGSALTDRDYRDVDVRMMLDDDMFAAMFGNPRWLALANAAMSEWLVQSTGLPIDFQFQDTTKANAENSGGRNPLGMTRGR